MMNRISLLMYTYIRAAVTFLVFLPLLYDSYGFCYESVYIQEIKVKGCQSIDEDVVQRLIGLEQGGLLKREALRKGLIRAFRKDIFDDIMVTREFTKKGITITIYVIEMPIIKKIKFKGNKHVSTDDLKKIFIFKEGQRLKEQFNDRALKELAAHYREKGFPYTQIDLINRENKNGSLSLEVKVDEGAPLIIADFNTSSEMKKWLTLKKGDIYDREILENNVEKALVELKEQGHYRPIIGPLLFSHGVVEIPYDAGPVLDAHFKGNEAVDNETLMRQLPFIEGADVNEYLIKEASRRIIALYEKIGYPDIKVAVGIEEKDNNVDMSFFIFEGRKVMVKNVVINGAHSFAHESLVSVMATQKGEPFSQTILTRDLEAFKTFYHNSGYVNFSIEKVVTNLSDTKEQIDIVMYLNEGEQSLIKDIIVSGNRYFHDEEINQALSVQKLGVYNEDLVRDGRFIIKRMYAYEGYSDTQVKVDTEHKGRDFLVTYSIDEGEQFTIGKIIIRGNETTQREIIQRELTINEGDIYREREMIKTRNRIQRIGLFNEVTLTSHKAIDNVKDVVITIKESKRGVVELGFGYGEYEHFKGVFDVRYKNLWGTNKEVGFTTDIDRLEQIYSLYYKQPYLYNRYLPFTATVTGGRKKAIDDDNGDDTLYKVNRFSLIFGVEKEFSKNLEGTLDYEYTFVDTKQIDPDVILSPEDTGTTAIGSIVPSLTYDTRNNRFDPHSGILTKFTLEAAATPLASQNDFIKLTLNTSTYHALIKDSVFALSLRGGIADSFGDTETLPIVERFFLGGRSTVRGYKKNNLGPKVNDNPTGGNVFAMFNAEIRIPIKWGLGLVTFVDGGNVWQEIEDINEDKRLRYTTGAGLRYSTPVGPLSIDYGQKLSRDKSSDESHGEVHFSIGHAF